MRRTRPRPVSNCFRLYLLGQFRLESHPASSSSRRPPHTVQLATHKLESLFSYLVLHPGPQVREKLAALYWGDAPESHARNSLRNALSTLRKTLGASALDVDRVYAGINCEFPLWVDTLAFKSQCQTFLAAPSSTCNGVDLTLYRGDLLQDHGEEWIAPERAEMRTLFLETALSLVKEARAQGDYARAIQLAQLILAHDPANERAHQHLMFAFLVTGDRRAALAQYQSCHRALQAELDVDPMPETTALYEWIKQSERPGKQDEARLTNLPIPVSSFVGRQREIRELKSLIRGARLVTITGAGGSGKTRLAIQTATDLIDAFKDGVRWVEFGAIEEPSLVPQAIARAFGLRESTGEDIGEKLARLIDAREILLVLDNCEHLLAACATVAGQLLSKCPNLKILATSRERLGITGEVGWLIPLFLIPDRDGGQGSLRGNDAVQLFAARARAVKADLVLTEENLPIVAHICKRLDGMPLAIELAAARVGALSLKEISSRLDDRFSLLTTGSRTALPRQQTLRALVDWSYDLLSSDERTLLLRLAVFVGGASSAAAQSICAGNGIFPQGVIDLLAHLHAKSLVLAAERDGETRYDLLDTVQQYACEKLDACGESAEMRNKHLDYYLTLSEKAEPELQRPDQVKWFNCLEEEYGNLRAALEWSLGNGNHPDLGLRLAGNLYWFWVVRGPLTEGRRWLEKALALNPPEYHSAERAKALDGVGEIAWNQSDLPAARAAYERALEIWNERKDAWKSAFGVLSLAWVLFNDGKLDQARAQFELAVRLARANGDKSLIARSLRGLGNSVMRTDYAEARPLLEEAADLFRQIGDRLRLAHTLNALANIALLEMDYPSVVTIASESVKLLHEAVDRVSLPSPLGSLGQGWLGQGQLDEAREAFREALDYAQENGDSLMVAKSLTEFAGLFLAHSELEQAARLFSAAEALVIKTGLPMKTLDRYNVVLAQHLEELRTRLADPLYAQYWEEGRKMTVEQAIALAMNA